MKTLIHSGTPRHSGRYPWGSGDDPYQRNSSWITYVKDLRAKGLSDTEIARGMGMKTGEFRSRNSLNNAEKWAADAVTVQKLKDKGYSNVAIGNKMGINESSVRNFLNPAVKARANITTSTVDMLKNQIAQKKYIDVGIGVENHIGVSRTRLKTAISALEDEGYKIHYLKEEQVGNPGKYTSIMVLGSPDSDYKELFADKTQVKTITDFSQDYGRSFLGLKPIKSIDPKRVQINYGDAGGADKDGVIELRRGIDDISLGNNKYAQVRIGVDGTHFLKGMAVYSDDLPDGIDVRFNTNKKTGTPMLGEKANTVLKNMKDEPDNPFGATVRQKEYIDKDGNTQLSALNIVNEEGEWNEWSKTISTQMLSKQPPKLAKQQLGLRYQLKKDEYKDLKSLTNPTVKKQLLLSYADDVDSSAVHLESAGFPRQRWQVILPVTSIKEGEVYAPNFRPGESVVLIRYPHGGRFEIPELIVTTKNAEAKSIMQNAADAIGIHPNVAKKLSGADFDGDTVLVIPNPHSEIKTSAAIKALQEFDPSAAYPAYEGMPKMKATTKQQQMGSVSNLITDMTIQGAPVDEIIRAVKHSMVVIDAEKHNLNYKLSAQENGISALKTKYQGGPTKGASTIISRTTSQQRVDNRRETIDPATGKKVYLYPGDTYTLKSGEVRVFKGDTYIDNEGRTIVRQIKSTKGAEAEDARSLSSGMPIEEVYATHANQLKALANAARKEALGTQPRQYSPSAKIAYKKEVASLNAQLNIALQNKPMERQATILANAIIKAKLEANPSMEAPDIKKLKGQALTEARARSGADKQQIVISPIEWEAIQAGAISTNVLTQILLNTNLDTVKQYAMPRTKRGISSSQLSRAQQLLVRGYTQAEVADSIGVSLSTLTAALE